MEAGKRGTIYMQSWKNFNFFKSFSKNIYNYTLRTYCRKLTRSKSVHRSNKGGPWRKLLEKIFLRPFIVNKLNKNIWNPEE